MGGHCRVQHPALIFPWSSPPLVVSCGFTRVRESRMLSFNWPRTLLLGFLDRFAHVYMCVVWCVNIHVRMFTHCYISEL